MLDLEFNPTIVELLLAGMIARLTRGRKFLRNKFFMLVIS